jgi:leucyl/phenylalanyl-tRNA--protein transferase
MPMTGVRELPWFSPDPRGIVPLGEFRPSRSLRRSARRFTVTADTAFAAVIGGCADPRRPGGWITPPIRAAYERLHSLGWAHSLEVWDAEGTLAGGLYGVEIGGLFAAESKFHVRTDASKVALLALVERLRAAGGERLLDVQWTTPHLAGLVRRDARAGRRRRLVKTAPVTRPPAEAERPACRSDRRPDDRRSYTATGSSTRRGSSVSRAITSRWICDVPS